MDLIAFFSVAALFAANTGAPAPAPMNPITGEWENPSTYLTGGDLQFYNEYMASQQKAQTEQAYQETWSEPAWQEPAGETGGWFDPWSAPNQYIRVGNYSASIVQGMDQWIVDAPGTAAMFSLDGKTVIGDHAFQGFKAIRWNNSADICGHSYRKVSEYHGWNDGYDIYLDDGRAIAYVPDGEIVMYTCLDGGGYNVAVTYWTAE